MEGIKLAGNLSQQTTLDLNYILRIQDTVLFGTSLSFCYMSQRVCSLGTPKKKKGKKIKWNLEKGKVECFNFNLKAAPSSLQSCENL